jgi:hypothetical protein
MPGMVAEGVALLAAVSSIRKDRACQVPVRGAGDWPEPAVSDAGLLPPTDVSPALCGAPSWVLSLRAEVEALRNEVRQVREEVEYWKAESHRHFCDAQYWRAMHQQALERIAQRDQEIERLKADVRRLRQQLFGRKTEKGKAGQLPQDLEKAPTGRRRGQQLGHAGHGRRDHSHLPAVVTFLDLPTDARCCPRCRQPYAVAAKRDEQRGPRNLHPACRKTLESLNEHWKGLTLFVAHPDVPMDNNRTERTQRGPVVGRKNYYGSGARWSGKLAAMLFSLFATLRLHGINPRQWLTAYLEACAAAGGKAPQNAADFLPWNLPAEAKEAMHAPFLATPEVNNSS